MSQLAPRETCRKSTLRLPVGSLEDLALGRVVPEQLLNQIHMRKQHATAAVAGESQFAQRFAITHPQVSKTRDSLSSIVGLFFFFGGISRTLRPCPPNRPVGSQSA